MQRSMQMWKCFENKGAIVERKLSQVRYEGLDCDNRRPLSTNAQSSLHLQHD